MNDDNLIEPSEYFPQQWLAREETIGNMYTRYKREYEKLRFYNSYDKTLCEIELLPEIRTEYGD